MQRHEWDTVKRPMARKSAAFTPCAVLRNLF